VSEESDLNDNNRHKQWGLRSVPRDNSQPKAAERRSYSGARTRQTERQRAERSGRARERQGCTSVAGWNLWHSATRLKWRGDWDDAGECVYVEVVEQGGRKQRGRRSRLAEKQGGRRKEWEREAKTEKGGSGKVAQQVPGQKEVSWTSNSGRRVGSLEDRTAEGRSTELPNQKE
jgi:hypothetical protein